MLSMEVPGRREFRKAMSMAKRIIHGGRRKKSALPDPEDPHRARVEEAAAASMVVKLKEEKKKPGIGKGTEQKREREIAIKRLVGREHDEEQSQV